MTIVKLSRDGRLTLPSQVLQALHLSEGALLQAEVRNGAVLLCPLDRKAAKRRIRELLGKSWQATTVLSDEEWDDLVSKAVAAAKRQERKRLRR